MSEIYYYDNIKYTDILKWFLVLGDIEDIDEVRELVGYENVNSLLDAIKTKSTLIDVMRKVKCGLKSIHYTITEEASGNTDIIKYKHMRDKDRAYFLAKGYIRSNKPSTKPPKPPKQTAIYKQVSTNKQIIKFLKYRPYHRKMLYTELVKGGFVFGAIDELDEIFINRIMDHLEGTTLLISIDRMATNTITYNALPSQIRRLIKTKPYYANIVYNKMMIKGMGDINEGDVNFTNRIMKELKGTNAMTSINNVIMGY